MLLEREERLRKARSRAQTLRAAFPGAAVVEVHLQFLPVSLPPHAAQSFLMYPGARAFFGYPCPYGDCDGIFDLAAEADRTLVGERSTVTGTIECTGVRARDGLPRQPCRLPMSYTIAAQLSASTKALTS